MSDTDTDNMSDTDTDHDFIPKLINAIKYESIETITNIINNYRNKILYIRVHSEGGSILKL